MSNYGENYYLEELEEMKKEKVVTIIPEKQIIIDKSDLDFIHKQYKDKIADLEAKLKESVEIINEWIQLNIEKSTEINKLKQQLAESESKARIYAKEIVFLDKQLKEKEKEETKRMEGFEKRCQEYYNSDEYKKDFAIAELEKVKKEFNGAFSISIQQKMFDKYINQQIKSLKGDADGSTN